MVDAPVLSHGCLVRNPWPKPSGVLEHCREGDTNCLFSIFLAYPSNHLSEAMKVINVHFFINSSNSCKLYQGIRGNFLKLLRIFVSIRNCAKLQEDADCYTHLRIVHGSRQCIEGSIQGHHLTCDDSLLYCKHQQVALKKKGTKTFTFIIKIVGMWQMAWGIFNVNWRLLCHVVHSGAIWNPRASTNVSQRFWWFF